MRFNFLYLLIILKDLNPVKVFSQWDGKLRSRVSLKWENQGLVGHLSKTWKMLSVEMLSLVNDMENQSLFYYFMIREVLQNWLTRPYYLRGSSCLDSSLFWFKNTLTPLYLSRDKTKGQSGKNATLTPTKIFPKK